MIENVRVQVSNVSEEVAHETSLDERITLPMDRLRTVLLALWNRRRLLIGGWLLALLLAVAFVLIVPKNYEATMVIAPPDYNSPSLAMMSALGSGAEAGAEQVLVLGAGAPDLLGVKNPGDMYVRAMLTVKVEDRIIDLFQFAHSV